jgi:uncharacterized membrane protein
MATISVLKFETADGAEGALDLIKRLNKQQLIKLHDAAIVTWSEGKSKPKTKQLVSLAGVGALDGAFWGMLFGLLFFVPFFGMAIGAAMGALSGKFADYGIDDEFIKKIRSEVTEGTSALFLMTSDAVMDKVQDAVKEHDIHFTIVTTNLSKEQEEELRQAFEAGAEEEEA